MKVYGRLESKIKGRRDGAVGYPPIQADGVAKRSGHESDLDAAARAAVARIERRWERRAKPRLKGRWGNAAKTSRRAADVATKRREDLLLHPEPEGASGAIHWYGRGVAMWLLLALMAVVEAPFLAIVFQSVVESDLGAYIAGIGLGAVVSICAHRAGVLTRRRDENGSLTRAEAAYLAACIGFAGLTVLVSAWMRERFASRFSEWLGIQLSGWMVVLVFFSVSALFFVGAAAAAHEHSNPVAVRRRNRMRAQRRADAAESALLQARRREERRYRRYAARHARTRLRAEGVEPQRDSLVALYQRANERRRAKMDPSVVPIRYAPNPAVSVPLSLQALDTDLVLPGEPSAREITSIRSEV